MQSKWVHNSFRPEVSQSISKAQWCVSNDWFSWRGLSTANEASPTIAFSLKKIDNAYFSKVVVSVFLFYIFFLNPYLKLCFSIQIYSTGSDEEPQNLFQSSFLQVFANITWQNVAFFLVCELFLPGFNFAMSSWSVLDSDTSYRSKDCKKSYTILPGNFPRHSAYIIFKEGRNSSSNSGKKAMSSSKGCLIFKVLWVFRVFSFVLISIWIPVS